MGKLIDGDELIELLLSTAITDKQREYSECVQYAVEKMPTVDAVSVVRCGDCIRYHPDDDVWGRCTVMPYKMRKNDYCSYGVIDDMRKDGDHHDSK